jgi:hypothetical protein
MAHAPLSTQTMAPTVAMKSLPTSSSIRVESPAISASRCLPACLFVRVATNSLQSLHLVPSCLMEPFLFLLLNSIALCVYLSMFVLQWPVE